jgi:hypothetical protein
MLETRGSNSAFSQKDILIIEESKNRRIEKRCEVFMNAARMKQCSNEGQKKKASNNNNHYW